MINEGKTLLSIYSKDQQSDTTIPNSIGRQHIVFMAAPSNYNTIIVKFPSCIYTEASKPTYVFIQEFRN